MTAAVKLRPALADNLETLSDAALVAYFADRRNVVYPELPPANAEHLERADRILDNEFTYTGETFRFAEGFSFKPNPSLDKEWQIAFHKCYFLIDLAYAFRTSNNPLYFKQWMKLIDAWIAEMGSGYIVRSDAQVEAKRIESWVYSFILLQGTSWSNLVTGSFLRRFLGRIAEEAGYISEHLKPVRNHRTFQLYAIFLAAVVFPELRRHEEFLRFGAEKLTENLLTDFLPDGVHVELSTHYHQLVVETGLRFVELASDNNVTIDAALIERLRLAVEFSLYMQWPNGDIPLINDSDNGEHRDMLELASRLLREPCFRWGATLGRAGQAPQAVSRHFETAGYFVFSDTWGDDPISYAQRQHVFYDCARLGEGSHSHYDVFNFCYFVNREPAIIDPGRYTYSSDPDAQGIDWRKRFKSTAYHNTVTIDGFDQTRYLSRTKHGPDAQVTDFDSVLGPHTDWVAAKVVSQEYEHVHERVFVYMGRQYLFIFDRITMADDRPHSCALHFHLPEQKDEEITCTVGSTTVRVNTRQCQILGWQQRELTASLEPGWVSRYYGCKSPAPIARFELTGSQSVMFCTVVAPRTAAGGQAVELSLTKVANASAVAFQVKGHFGNEVINDEFFIAQDQSTQISCSPDEHAVGRFVVLRRDPLGELRCVTGRQISSLHFKQAPMLSLATPENFQWMR